MTKIRLSIPLSQENYEKLKKDAIMYGTTPANIARLIIGNYYKELKEREDEENE